MDPRYFHQQPRRIGSTRGTCQGSPGGRCCDFFRNGGGGPASAEGRRVQFFRAGGGLGLYGVCGVEVCDGDELFDGGK